MLPWNMSLFEPVVFSFALLLYYSFTPCFPGICRYLNPLFSASLCFYTCELAPIFATKTRPLASYSIKIDNPSPKIRQNQFLYFHRHPCRPFVSLLLRLILFDH